jgi:hypothetical protein
MTEYVIDLVAGRAPSIHDIWVYICIIRVVQSVIKSVDYAEQFTNFIELLSNFIELNNELNNPVYNGISLCTFQLGMK